MYRPYTPTEDRERTNSHYEQPTPFFYALTGGQWNVYSCNLWDGARTDTESQVAKLDLLAQLMELKPGQRVLDVGCGWGGPLVYLATRYGITGVGLTLSSLQRRAAEERAARWGAHAQFVESHWSDYRPDTPFDVVYTDEVIVHFFDLAGFFRRVHSWLRPGGRMLNKELHLTHRRYSAMSRTMSHINEIFGGTGNYRTLAEELELVGQAGFEVQRIHQLPTSHYQKTVDRWEENLLANRADLEPLVGAD
ncbi:MAG TPA: class I SAM-dependent methyltransferase, partial [Armatimonadota bacterium]|nr:class I SAM-dependent methyltransferase [Armatimonadota bacterium]